MLCKLLLSTWVLGKLPSLETSTHRVTSDEPCDSCEQRFVSARLVPALACVDTCYYISLNEIMRTYRVDTSLLPSIWDRECVYCPD